MYIIAAFASLFTFAVAPFLLFAVLSDLTKKVFCVWVCIMLLCAAIGWTHSSFYPATFAHWAFDGVHGALTAIGLTWVVASAVVIAIARHRRAIRRLEWPSQISQSEMQKLGYAYLTGHGWSLTQATEGFAGANIFMCRKNDLRMVAIFARRDFAFNSFVRSIRKAPGIVFSRVILIQYEKPTESFKNTVRLEGFTVVHYKELEVMDDVCLRIESSRIEAVRQKLVNA